MEVNAVLSNSIPRRAACNGDPFIQDASLGKRFLPLDIVRLERVGVVGPVRNITELIQEQGIASVSPYSVNTKFVRLRELLGIWSGATPGDGKQSILEVPQNVPDQLGQCDLVAQSLARQKLLLYKGIVTPFQNNTYD
jgi:hypothetical protein